jgi:hypothetical protein
MYFKTNNQHEKKMVKIDKDMRKERHVQIFKRN